MSTVRIPAKHHQARCDGVNAQLAAEVATGALSGHMLAVARQVSGNPKSFSPDDAAKLRNAAQVAQSAADLIDGGIKL